MNAAYTATDGLLQRVQSAPPAKPCLVAEGRVLSYGDLNRRARVISAEFAQRGWQPGTCLLIVTTEHRQALCLLIAALRSGLIPLVGDVGARPAEALLLLTVAKIGAAVIDEELLPNWPLAERAVPCWPLPSRTRPQGALYQRLLNRNKAVADWFSQLDAMPAPQDAARPLAQTPAKMLFFTSGSTSTAKAVELGLPAIEAHLATLQRQFGYGPESRLLNLLPWNHVDGLIQGSFNALWSQATLYRPMAFRIENVQRLLDTLYADRISHFVAVPTMLAIILKLADALKDAFASPDLKVLISTAGHLEADLWQRFEARFAVRVCNVYGLTETVAGGLFSGPDDLTRRLGTLGKPVDCTARVLDPQSCEVAAGEVGELVLQGHNLMHGYFDNPEATAAALRDGWLHTGDRVRVDTEGYYHFQGRIKNTLVSGGHNIQPEEITSVLKTFASVADAATIGMPHPELEEVPVSAVVATQGMVIDLAALNAYCREQLADYKVPRSIILLPEMPYGPSGKVRTEALRALIAAHTESSGAGVDQPIETQVLELAASCFGGGRSLSLQASPDVTPGWDSIAHLEFVLSLEARFSIVLLPRHIIGLTSLSAAVDIVRSILDE